MEKEIVKISADEVAALYKDVLKKNEKQMQSLLFESSETPLTGTISRLVPEPKEYGGNKYFVYEVIDDNGKVVGEISVNRLFDTEVRKDDVLIIANGNNKGKVMLRSHRLSNTSHLGKSRAEQIANAVGTKYKAERVKVVQIVDYTPEKLFGSANAKGEVTATVKNALWLNTTLNEKAMRIEWI